MTTASLPHDHAIAVGSDQIDFMGHVNNARYLSWVQDAVLNHWHKLAPADAVASKAWVALRDHATPGRYRKVSVLPQ